MAIKFIDDTILTAIANAIRSKLSSSNTYKPSEMATAIGSISGGITPTGTISITQNGTVDVTNYASASVNVSSASPWVDVTPDLANGTNGTGTASTYSNGALRVYSTSNGTYRSYDVPITLESGKKYRMEFTLSNAKTTTTNTAFINASDSKVMVGFQKADSASYAIETTLSDMPDWSTNGKIRFYCTWSTSAAGDATWTNFKVYKYTGS